ncbi:MAG: hypothetical protein KatS3mg114_0460 [Planctomycetaceae bacterium]|nr:MAG: hypothetical protein KatS3mg114_0460 [Planctomycetaceae bacterium]
MTSSPTSHGTATPDRAMAYVDGFNLYFGLKSKNFRRYYWLDIERLVSNLLRPGQQLVGVKYFTADLRSGNDKWRRQQTFLDALQTHTTQLEIIRGHYLIKQRQCRQCGHTVDVPEEKKTDVNIATHLMTDAFLDRFDTALVISGDSDLVPPLEMIRRHQPEKRVVVGFPPGRQSSDLKRVAHGSFWINEQKLRVSQLPNPVVKPNGHALHRPSQWK